MIILLKLIAIMILIAGLFLPIEFTLFVVACAFALSIISTIVKIITIKVE